ncbi:MAG: lactonase family protein [Candidatus Latescibacteria bacterium]|nr:lactonase family protein [Candidatus Latescibacterota bacterium]
MAEQRDTAILVYIGTWTNDDRDGIYVYRLDPASGALDFISKATEGDHPFFLALDARHRYLYAANAVQECDGQPGGAISAFAIDAVMGGLTRLNRQPSHGTLPCYLSLDQTGRYVFTANYSSGSVAVLPIQADGRLGPATAVVQHTGSSVNPQRQDSSHVHAIVPDPTNRYVVAADLGLDQLRLYRFDATQGVLTPHDPPWVQVAAGAGPRHIIFHPNGRYAFLINELDNTIVAYAYDAAQGTLTELQTTSTLPAGWTDATYSADIRVGPSGRVLYGSNRGHDSIALFLIDEATGRLTPAGHAPAQGAWPWNLAIDPTAAFLLAANNHSDRVVVFRLDEQTGQLVFTGHTADVPAPVCIAMMPRTT